MQSVSSLLLPSKRALLPVPPTSLFCWAGAVRLLSLIPVTPTERVRVSSQFLHDTAEQLICVVGAVACNSCGPVFDCISEDLLLRLFVVYDSPTTKITEREDRFVDTVASYSGGSRVLL
jgi:hypothetical protein